MPRSRSGKSLADRSSHRLIGHLGLVVAKDDAPEKHSYTLAHNGDLRSYWSTSKGRRAMPCASAYASITPCRLQQGRVMRCPGEFPHDCDDLVSRPRAILLPGRAVREGWALKKSLGHASSTVASYLSYEAALTDCTRGASKWLAGRSLGWKSRPELSVLCD